MEVMGKNKPSCALYLSRLTGVINPAKSGQDVRYLHSVYKLTKEYWFLSFFIEFI